MRAIDETLEIIRKSFSSPALDVISSLAEGADRLVAKRALLHPQTTLTVPLPLPIEQYITDFSDSRSVEEFFSLLQIAHKEIDLPEANSREEAYQTSSQYILDCCDVLLAVWDGQEALGKGGTGEFALQARQRGHPLAWIHAGNRIPGTSQAATLNEEQGLITVENFPG